MWIRNRSRSTSRTPWSRRSTRLSFESLESRRLMAVDAMDDSFNVNAFAGTQFVDVRRNDVNTEPQRTLRVTAVSPTTLGATVTIASGGQGVLYNPIGDYGVQDTFTYTVSDGAGNNDTATVTLDLVNQRVQTTLSHRQLVVPGELASSTLRWHDPDPNVTFTASLTWQDGTPPGFHLVQTSNADGTDATLSYWRTPTTYGDFNGALTIAHNAGYSETYSVQVGAVAVLLRPDAQDSTKTELAIGGLDNLNDQILFYPAVGGEKMVSPYVVQTVAGEPSVRLYYNGSNMGTFIADRIIVYGQGGNDLIQVNEAVTFNSWLFGQAGNDILVGGAGHDILIGSVGNDILYGFGGRDLVFGGLGQDYVQGAGWSGSAAGDDSDIVIGSYVSFDYDPALLNQVSQRWRSGDSYDTRVNSIRTNFPSLAQNQTVFDDWSLDYVFGATGQDWFFVEPTRDNFDRQTNETLN